MPSATILSPHPDDAVLSLWHVLAGPGEVHVLNVFDGRPERPGPGWWDRLTGAEDAIERWRERQAEDRAALASTGRAPDGLGLVGGQYRAGVESGPALAEPIAQATAAAACLYAPAALDGHPSHEAVRAAALELGRRGRRVALYADVPHCLVFGWPSWVTGQEPRDDLRPEAVWDHRLAASVRAGPPAAEVHALDDRALRAKRAAVSAYATQLPALEAQFGALLEGEALRYEVVWRLDRAG